MVRSCVASLSLALMLAACDGDEGSSTSPTTQGAGGTGAESSTDGEVQTTGGQASFDYEAMLERSLLAVGNNHRVKRVLEKAANGEEVTLAYIGGSITEGYTKTADESYVVGSYEAFKERFASGDGSHVHYVNAGMGGTPSTLGMIRYDRDVLQKAPTPPDLVFVEFAVNDGDDPTNGASYESLVRDILTAENEPAVVLLFSVFRSHWNLQDRLAPVGEDYELPMISIKDAVVPELDAGTLTHDEFFRDEYHPTSYGFGIMADTIGHYFATVDAAAADATDITLPDDATIGFQFTGITMVDPSTPSVSGTLEIEPGSFTEVDSALRNYEYSLSEKIFSTNWHKNATDANEPFTMSVTCKNLALVYKKSTAGTFGTAEVLVDGEVVETVEGNAADGWNNPWTLILLDEPESAPHTLEIRMAEDSADKFFTILALGYTP